MDYSTNFCTPVCSQIPSSDLLLCSILPHDPHDLLLNTFDEGCQNIFFLMKSYSHSMHYGSMKILHSSPIYEFCVNLQA
jgi:hypothetical protein